jgi:hypothetical protein
MLGFSIKLVIAAAAASLAAVVLFLIERSRMLASALISASLASLLGLGLALMNQYVWGRYGWTLFVLLPAAMGFAAVLIFASGKPIPMRQAIFVSLLAVGISGAELLLAAIEGAICLLMALPLAVPLAFVGALLAQLILRRSAPTAKSPVTMLLVIGLLPTAGCFEYINPTTPPVFAVTTSIDIPAPATTVWRATIAPSELGEPNDWIFRLGIAYPKAAHIDGTGPTATRYCNFSTGDLVEPVLRWEPPSLLRFAVTKNPEPMVEWSPYHIHPPHLNGFLVSRQGQFRLVPLPNGATRLEATTWYEHNLQPAGYWRWWSDAIIHRIHRRVLEHIRVTALQ